MSEPQIPNDPETQRLRSDAANGFAWKDWGPYLSERQWGTVREDYSDDGDVWRYFPHDHARSRAYRWGEDGLLGWSDHQGQLCFALALWNGKDAILKERLFGLNGHEGNHAEDVKELYYFIDATPTFSYCRALYKYPQQAFPYERLVSENAKRDRTMQEFELLDTGVFDANRYFDVTIEYAKASAQDTCIRFTVANRATEAAELHLLPTLWFRNTWDWGPMLEDCAGRPQIARDAGTLRARHELLGEVRLSADPAAGSPTILFTDNDTNVERLFGTPNKRAYVKDAFHHAVIEGDTKRCNPLGLGTKAALCYRAMIPAGGELCLRLRLARGAPPPPASFAADVDAVFAQRRAEADQFYALRLAADTSPEKQAVARSAMAGLLWAEQFYFYMPERWSAGDPTQVAPPSGHRDRNVGWEHLYARNVLTMPDTWEFPYFCCWDSAFHCVSLSSVDLDLAKRQLTIYLREWFMHRNGQLPAYEFNFSDVNPPVHPWAVWRVYRLPGRGEKGDRAFLEASFQKLLLNFTWWVNREDRHGNNLFSGGFLGLDNIGVFDRSKPLPTGGFLLQADGTAWMAFYCIHMLSMALELAREDPIYEDMASKFLEHFGAITRAINGAAGTGLWDETDGFYYDRLQYGDDSEPLRVRSIVGFIPMLATTLIRDDSVGQFKEFIRRAAWNHRFRPELARHILELHEGHGDYLLTISSREHLERMLARLLDENEFLSPYGIRSLSKFHQDHPYVYASHGQRVSVSYEPGEGTTGMFGGNSNWRGPIWFPVNYLLLESLRVYHRFYGDSFKVAFPTGSSEKITLGEVARRIAHRLQSLFLADPDGRRPCHGEQARYAKDPHWKDLLLFHEYYHGDSGRGCGASHQTGWTALVADLINLESHWLGC